MPAEALQASWSRPWIRASPSLHPEFAGLSLTPGYDFVQDDATPEDANGHGTHITGILAAGMDNGHGTTGIAPDVTIMPVRVLNASNIGTWAGVASGITYAVDHGARIINLSLGGLFGSQTLQQAIQYAAAHNIFMVASSGNMANDMLFYPAAYSTLNSQVFAVSATTSGDQWWTFSNYGPWVDISAPGDQMWSTYLSPNGADVYTSMSGTSMAAPLCQRRSGITALGSPRPDRRRSPRDPRTLGR